MIFPSPLSLCGLRGSRASGAGSALLFSFPSLLVRGVEAAKLGCSAAKPCAYPRPVLAGKGAAGGDRRLLHPILGCRRALPWARRLQGTQGFPTHRGADLRLLLRDQAARRTPMAGRTPRPVTALGLRSGDLAAPCCQRRARAWLRSGAACLAPAQHRCALIRAAGARGCASERCGWPRSAAPSPVPCVGCPRQEPP